MRTLTQELTARISREDWPAYGDMSRAGRILRQAQLALASPLMRTMSRKESRALVAALRRTGYQIPPWLVDKEMEG